MRIFALTLALLMFTSESSADGEVQISIGLPTGYIIGYDCTTPNSRLGFHPRFGDGFTGPWGYSDTESCGKIVRTMDFVLPPGFEPPTDYEVSVTLGPYTFTQCAPVYVTREETALWGDQEIHFYVCVLDYSK